MNKARTPVDSETVDSIAQLEAYFESGCRDRSDWKVGVEYETPVVDASDARAVSYEGSNGIGALLACLEESMGWHRVEEAGRIIALKNDHASLTLEPGGQLEMSGQQCDSLHCADRELRDHVAAISAAGRELGLRFLGLGATPATDLAVMPWMPKERYRIMQRVMSATGSHGHRMMQQTATVQANFDFDSEDDARKKMRLAMALPPVVVAVSANSPLIDGRLTGYKSFRARVWADTDPARCGILPFVFDTESLFGAYTRYALDVPLYFLERNDRLIPCRGETFRDLLEGRIDGERAFLSDWATHLTTLFPEARLKTYIELRSADCQPIDAMLSPPAFMKGLVYDNDCLEAAIDTLSGWTAENVRENWQAAAKHGLSARAGRHTLRDYARELLAIAEEGLRRQAALDDTGNDETMYLRGIRDTVESGITPADAVITNWTGIWRESFPALIEHVGLPNSKSD